jgi:hypothetical protein
MATNPARQDAEHRLASLVAAWVKTCEEKAGVVSEYNKDIKGLEEAIEKLSAEIQGGTFQPTLPFDEPKGPVVLLSDSDPDVQAAEQEAAAPAEDLSDVDGPGACAHCGHPEGVHGTTRKRGCMRAECECKGYVHPNPLSVANIHAEPEKREAEL